MKILTLEQIDAGEADHRYWARRYNAEHEQRLRRVRKTLVYGSRFRPKTLARVLGERNPGLQHSAGPLADVVSSS